MPVPAVVVKLVGAALLNAVVLAVGHTRVPPLNVKFFVPVAVVNAVPTVSVCPFKFNVPLFIVKVPVEPIVNASISCQVPPTPLNVMGKSSVFVAVVMVLVPEVAAKVIVPVPAVGVAMPDTRVKLP